MSGATELGLLILVVGGLIYTKPSTEKIESYVEQMVTLSAKDANVDPNENFLQVLTKSFCKAAPKDCYAIIRSTISFEINDYLVAQDIKIKQDGKNKMHCIGLINTVWCPAFLNEK